MPHCTNNVHCTQVMDLFPLPSVTLFKLLSNLISYCAWMLLEQENICKKKTAKLSWLFNSCHFITFLHDFFCTETRGTHSGASFLLSSISSYCPLIVRQTKAWSLVLSFNINSIVKLRVLSHVLYWLATDWISLQNFFCHFPQRKFTKRQERTLR